VPFERVGACCGGNSGGIGHHALDAFLAALAVSHTRDSVHDEDSSPSAAPPDGRVLRRRRRRHRSSRVRRVFGRGWLLVTLTRVCTTRTGVLRRRRPRASAAAAAEPSLSHTSLREFWAWRMRMMARFDDDELVVRLVGPCIITVCTAVQTQLYTQLVLVHSSNQASCTQSRHSKQQILLSTIFTRRRTRQSSGGRTTCAFSALTPIEGRASGAHLRRSQRVSGSLRTVSHERESARLGRQCGSTDPNGRAAAADGDTHHHTVFRRVSGMLYDSYSVYDEDGSPLAAPTPAGGLRRRTRAPAGRPCDRAAASSGILCIPRRYRLRSTARAWIVVRRLAC